MDYWKTDKAWTEFIFQGEKPKLIKEMINNEFGLTSWFEYSKFDLTAFSKYYLMTSILLIKIEWIL